MTKNQLKPLVSMLVILLKNISSLKESGVDLRDCNESLVQIYPFNYLLYF